MSVFSAAVDRIFADRNMAVDAFYKGTGDTAGRAVRAILSSPDDSIEFGASLLTVETLVNRIRISEVVKPARGDEISIDGATYAVQEGARRDAERLTWTFGARPKAT